ncbi:hypothetical protein J18TS1_44610 [Oceanobacillus oncorhynchi subsp. incaldanensis]|uniref:DUF6220 domain-containing protein n=1 Tax=Oceanobacillus oncorhynchi TaxID=545501 RepID=UPI001B2D6896|nr:DUF6220 domain-containing protein [Oceanobacillus oncorhynchi]GIO21361.1 hypothetical protein J18TS1_44610 [Oceanobacillus oncorhynchi subsp. incaldanensis]
MQITGRWIYAVFSMIFLICTLAQFFLAGMAIFGGGQFWSAHKMLVHLFGLNVPVIMMIGAFMGNSKKNDYFFILGLFILIVTLYASANLGFLHSYLGALHPVLGFLITILSIGNLYRSIVPLKNRT